MIGTLLRTPDTSLRGADKMRNHSDPKDQIVWYGINIVDLMSVPGIEAVGAFLLPPQENSYNVIRGPNVDDNYVFWAISQEKAEGIDSILKIKAPRLRTQTLTKPPEPYKKRR